MKSSKRALKILAKNYRVDADEILIMLWDLTNSDKFNYLKNGNSIVKIKDLKLIKSLINDRLKNKKQIQENKKNFTLPKIEYKEHNFSNLGKALDQEFFLKKDEILKIYAELVADFQSNDDPIQPSGLKDENLLEGAIYLPMTSYSGLYKYSTAESAAAALMYGLSQDHAFYNGNKRTAMVSMLVFLDRHNICLTCDEDELFMLSLKVADHKLVPDNLLYSDAEIYELTSWIVNNSKVMKKGERLITLKKFKQIINRFDCEILENGKVQRVIKKRNFLNIPVTRKLTSKKLISHSISDGKQMDRKLIKSIRDDLELNEEHGVDMEVFYEREEFTSSDFIHRYRTLLKRLSRV